MQQTRFITILTAFAWLALAPAVWAQQASGIAGLVKDTSGAVLPGVTVEAASPALIEKVRSAVSDGQGRFNVVDLRPGTYVVTFALPGFNTLRREGIQLTAGFTATINVDMQVGALEETVTVTGESPLVDVQNVKQQKVVSDELLSALPSASRAMASIVAIIPGMVGAGDVGGSSGIYTSNTTWRNMYHGKGGVKFQYDGMRTNNMGAHGATSYVMNGATSQETTVDTGGVSAESSASGALINLIPKEGGNAFKYEFFGFFTGESLQTDNLDDRLRSRGLTTGPKALGIYDFNGTFGGPIKADKVWFFTAGRVSQSKIQVPGVFFNTTKGTPFYTAGDPAYRQEWLKSQAVRLTWQASQKNKISVFADVQSFTVRGRGNFISPEAGTGYNIWPAGLAQVSWSSPRTSKLLLEAGASLMKGPWHYPAPGDRFQATVPGSVSFLESSTGFRYNSPATWTDFMIGDRHAQRFAMSYVTGSHAFKGGIQFEEGVRSLQTSADGDLNYTLTRGVPTSITQRATPYLQKDRFLDLGLYLQDQWSLSRFTFNYGVRWDYFYGWVAPQQVAAGRFVGARSFDRVGGVPNWTDLNPRLGVSYDLFGNGRTAVKASLGRYVEVMAVELTNAINPITTSVNNVDRTWGDANGNFAPDCDLRNPLANGECGQINNLNFGRPNVNTRYADDVINGYGARNATWDFAAEVQHELRRGISLTGGYYRNWASNFRVTDNQFVTPGSYSPYCITAPRDSRLPGGGGYQVCGLYDVTPALFGRVDNVVTQLSNFAGSSVNCDTNGSLTATGGSFAVGDGRACGTSDFFNVSINTRLSSGITIGGGVDTGRSVYDACYEVDSPQQRLNCRVVRPFHAQTQLKMYGTYPFPGDFMVSGTLQNVAGPNIEAIYQASNTEIAPSLGRSLATCGTRNPCTATVPVPLVAPMTLFEDRRTQLDLRVSKVFKMASGARFQANFDIYNALNANSILGVNSNFGARWQFPVAAQVGTEALMNGRSIQVGGELRF